VPTIQRSLSTCSPISGKRFPITDSLKGWMQSHGYQRLVDFHGKLSQEASSNPAAYGRVQFMRYFGGEKEVT
jgi:hypothetical protein